MNFEIILCFFLKYLIIVNEIVLYENNLIFNCKEK